VLGHAQCGGIQALMRGSAAIDGQESFISSWMRLAEQARSKVLQEMPDASSKVLERACEQQAILSSLDNLMSFNWIRERVEDGRLKLHGWYFDIEHGQLLQYEADNCRFNAM